MLDDGELELELELLPPPQSPSWTMRNWNTGTPLPLSFLLDDVELELELELLPPPQSPVLDDVELELELELELPSPSPVSCVGRRGTGTGTGTPLPPPQSPVLNDVELELELFHPPGAHSGICCIHVFVVPNPRMKIAACTFLLASPLLLIFGLSGKYYDCSPPLWQTTAANFSAEGWCAQFGVIVLWCAMQVLFRCILAGIIVPRRSHLKAVLGCNKRIARVTAWIMWICIVTLLSLPSIFFTFAQSIPAQNTWDLSENLLTFFQMTAPVQAVLIDMVLAARISSKFSKLTGLKADRLLMTFRLFSAWLLAALTTIALDENCLSGWKLAWKVCEEGSKENSKFNWKIYDEELLNTTRDICTFTETWWSDGRCSRAIVGGLTPFLLKKLLTRSTLQPLLLWTTWHFSRLEPAGDPRQGRHRRLFGVWRRTTRSLIPFEQMALLTTLLDAWKREAQATP